MARWAGTALRGGGHPWTAVALLPSLGCSLLVGDPDGHVLRPAADAGADGRSCSGDACADVVTTGAEASALTDAPPSPDADAAPVADGGGAGLTTLATGQLTPRGIVVVHGVAYWVNEGEAAVREVAVAGDGGAAPAPTVLFSNTSLTTDIVSDGISLYAVGGAAGGLCFGVVTVPLAAPASQGCLFGGSSGANVATRIALDPLALYLGGISYHANVIWFALLAGGAGAAALQTQTGPVTAIASDGKTAYFAADGTIYTQPAEQTTFQPGTFAAGTTSVNDLLVDGASVYWVTSDGDVLSLPTASAGGIPTTLATNQANATRMTSDDANLYWTNAGNLPDDGWVVTMPKAPATTPAAPVILASGQHRPFGIWREPTAVYWTNSGDGTVMAVAH